VALGPIGRSANAGTDARMGAEIYSYARSRGLFLGVSVNGASLSLDPNANAMLYGRAGITPADIYEAKGLAYHQEVASLINDVTARSRSPQTQVPVPGTTAKVPQPVPVQPVSAPAPAPAAPVAIAAPPAAPAPYAPPAAPVTPPLVPIR
jgi:hypothetical protein